MAFIVVFVLTLILTWAVKKLALYFNIVDNPPAGSESRKIHQKPIPLLGGLAIFLGFFFTLGIVYLWQPQIFEHLYPAQLWALFIGSTVLMLGGFLDDKYNFKPWQQFIFPVVAVLLVLYGGINLTKITNPFGGTINLDFFRVGGRLVAVDALVFVWLLGLTYTTKILDGLDGLVTGLTAIGSLMIFFLASTEKFYQPDVALVALIFAGANLGFLIFNFYPAKIFLGEGGSLLTGFVLGFLAIAAGGKIATTLLVMGLPALDVLATIIRRFWAKRSPTQSDAGHLHYRLLQKGFSQRQAVVFYYSLAVIFGILTLFLQSRQKFWALLVLALVAFMVIIKFNYQVKKV
jgi:UDP-GlcNAc:undecaprenyl-phosphate GlcNAc-1-phosphate transferase